VRFAAQSLLYKVVNSDAAASTSVWMHPQVSVCCVQEPSSETTSPGGSFASEIGSFQQLEAFVKRSKESQKDNNKKSLVKIRSVRCLDVGS